MPLYRVLINDRISKLLEQEWRDTGHAIDQIVEDALRSRYRPKRSLAQPQTVSVADMPEADIKPYDQFEYLMNFKSGWYRVRQIRRRIGQGDLVTTLREYPTIGEARAVCAVLKKREGQIRSEDLMRDLTPSAGDAAQAVTV